MNVWGKKVIDKIQTRDILPKEIEKAMVFDEVRNRIIVDKYKKNATKYGKTLVFAVSIEHAKLLTDCFNKARIKAAYVVSYTPQNQREKIYDSYRTGDLQVIVNMNILTEGTDLPMTQTVFLTRQTTSTILMTQMIGRALRGEETGGIGADVFCLAHQENKLPNDLDNLKCLIEIDRKGSNDAVFYDCYNKDFEAYITSKGFKSASGSFSDISLIAPELGVAAVNLSSGYYNAHTLHEFINRAELEGVIFRVVEIVADTASSNFPQYKYVEKPRQKKFCSVSTWEPNPFDNDLATNFAYFDDESTSPQPLPIKYQQIYEELLEVYTPAELDELRLACGDHVLLELYFNDFYNEK